MSKSKPAAPAKPRIQGALTKDQVNAQFNPAILIPTKIRGALAELGEAACKPNDFARLSGLSTSQLAQFEEQFAAHVVYVREGGHSRALWCGDANFADSVREDLARG